MRKALLLICLFAFAATAQAQQTTFVPNCGGDDDTARFVAIITKIGTNTGTIRLPYKDGIRCAVSSLTIPDNITLDNSDGTGISARASATLLVVGPVVNPIGKPMFFGPGAISFTGNTHIGAAGQARLSNGLGGETWGDVTSGGGIGPTTGSGLVVLQTNPTIVGAALTGATTATSINKLTITPPATGATLTIGDSKTLTVASTLNLSGTDGTSVVFGQPLTVGGTAGVTLTGGGTMNFAGFTGTMPATGTFAMGAAALSVNTTNNTATANHTHAINSSANPGASASLLATDTDGDLQLVRLGLGTAPTQPLEVAGNAFINAPTANLFMKDIATGWRASTSLLVNPQPNNSVCTTNFTSGLVGWCIRDSGNAEFENVDVRGAIHASVFVYNALQATAGTFGVFKSAAKLKTDVTIPNGPTYGTTTVNIDVVDQEGITHAASQLFATGDILRLKDGLVGDTWLRVASTSDQTTFWRYTSTIMAGSANATYRAGLGVADYGASGQGFIIQTADQTNAPYLQMATHGATFTSTSSSGTLSVTPRMRCGNLNGSYGFVSDTFGCGFGQYGVVGQTWSVIDPVNGFRVGNNTTVLTQVDAAGNASFTGSVTANAGNIGGFTITANRLSAGTLTNTVGLDSTVTGGDDVRFFAGSATPSSAPFRVTESGALFASNATITGTVNATSGTFAGSLSAATGTFAGSLSAASGTFTGDLTGASMALTGKLTMSGASSAIAIGTTPPTSSSAGTGVWIDRTGLYALSSGLQLARIDQNGLRLAAGNPVQVWDGAFNTGFLLFNAGAAQISTTCTNGSCAPLHTGTVYLTANNDGGNFAEFVLQQPASGTKSYANIFGNGSGMDGLLIGTQGAPVVSGSGAHLHINGDTIRIDTARTPASSAATCNVGEIAWDSSFIYVCVATNTWKRSAITTW
nr:flagellar hook-length control protein FliK [uncultured bacterium]